MTTVIILVLACIYIIGSIIIGLKLAKEADTERKRANELDSSNTFLKETNSKRLDIINQKELELVSLKGQVEELTSKLSREKIHSTNLEETISELKSVPDVDEETKEQEKPSTSNAGIYPEKPKRRPRPKKG